MPRPLSNTENEEQGRPMRRCVLSGAVRPKDEMVRFVVGPSDEIVADVDERLPGRGFWLSADRDMLMKAGAKHMFAKAARKPVRVPDNFADQVEGALVRRCMSLVGLARRAGQAVIGYEKSREWLKSGRAGIVVAASDGSAASRAKLGALASDVPIAVLRAEELGAAAGRDRAVHMVVSPGRLADSLKREAARLAGFRRADVCAVNCAGVDEKHL
jgi:predicted RNA-binding protein YlxR (DUF448 family)/ribosomal protein L30E